MLKTKMIIGLGIIVVIFVSGQAYQSHLTGEIEEVAQYHEFMSIPAISLLKDIQTEFEKLDKSVHGFKLGHNHDKEGYFLAKEKLTKKITQYEELIFVQNSNQEYFADSVMQNMMQDYVNKMNEKLTEYDDVAIKIFATSENDLDHELFNSLDKIHGEFDEIVQNDIEMETSGKNTQQEKIILIKESSNNLIFISNALILFSIISTTLIITKSISKQIAALRDTTNKISQGKFDEGFSPEKDEFQPLRRDIHEMAKTLKENQTELEEKHRNLLKSERFSAIGELSARLAHDIRNPSSTIKTGHENLRFLKDDPENFEKTLKRTDRAIDRISRQVDGVMDFVKDTELKFESISLTKLLNSIISEMTIYDEIKINLPSNNVTIQADKVKLISLFSNLILNAIQAMDNKGIITIRISEKSNNEAKIELENNGPSIPEENTKKIFEPLFTTKQTGTGLGLASVKKIVEQHGGTISVKNDPVIFTIVLPMRESQ